MSRCHCIPIIHIGHQPKYLEEIFVCGPLLCDVMPLLFSYKNEITLSQRHLSFFLSLSLSLSDLCTNTHGNVDPTLTYIGR